MILKLNIVTTVSALVFFFLPWTDIQCSSKSVATQTGIQTIYGGGSPSAEMRDMSKNQNGVKNGNKKDDSMGVSVLVGIALVAVIGAVVAAFMMFRGDQSLPANAVGVLCATAFVAIAIQCMVGFPVQRKLSESMAEATKTKPATGDPFEGVGAGMATAMMMNVQVKYLPMLYLELLALGIPTLVLANGILDRLKKSGGEAE